MVSPSKIFKSSQSGFNLDIGNSKKEDLKSNRGTKVKTSSGHSGHPGYGQLLSNTRFYLDIRNKYQLDKVEAILKAYGAKIEIFLRKDIKVIVTDKSEWIGNGQNPGSSVSPLTTPSPSTNQDQRFAVPKSRASAMLEKVSQQPASSCSSPLELARKWRIPVLSVRSLQKWIAKIEEAYMIKLNEKKKEEKVLENKIVLCARDKAPFIKVESIVSRNLPEFLELEAWPCLNLDGRSGQCPFRVPSPPSPIFSDDHPEKVDSQLFEVKDKVAVELIRYDTDFRIKENIKHWECEEGLGEQAEFYEIRDRDKTSLNRVQCNGLNSSHRSSKLLSPSGSDVLPLPSSRRSTRRASASWCGSTRELSQLSPTDSEIENIRRSDSSFEGHDPALDSPGITLRPKGQLWLPVALIGTTAEENGNCIRKKTEFSIRQSEDAKISNFFLDSFEEKSLSEGETNEIVMRKVYPENDVCISSDFNLESDCSIKKDANCTGTRKAKLKSEEMNGKGGDGSAESDSSCDGTEMKCRNEWKKRSLSVCDRTLPSIKRARTLSTNSVHSLARRKKLSPEEKLLQDNKEYFKMEVLNTKLRSTGSLLGSDQGKDSDAKASHVRTVENGLKKPRVGLRRGNRGGSRNRARTGNRKSNDSLSSEVKRKTNNKINGVLRKKRQTELMKLCNEAESFMFGEACRQGSKSEESEEGSKRKVDFPLSPGSTGIDTSRSAINNYQSPGKMRKKRRSHAEAFIHDNIDYYKFETPGSRLRHQGHVSASKSGGRDCLHGQKDQQQDQKSSALTVANSSSNNNKISNNNSISSSKRKNKKNDECEKYQDVRQDKLEPGERKRIAIKPSEGVEKILFSFERVPQTEPWYEVYKRQDEGLENYYPLLSNPNDQPFLLPYELPKPVYPKLPTVSEYYKRRRKKLLHLFNHPRKSPRCHASTLAILSSLKRRKRRSGTNISMSQLLLDSPGSGSSDGPDKAETERGGGGAEIAEEILDFLYEGESEVEDGEQVFLEPCGDSEGKCLLKSGKSDDEDSKIVRTSSRGRNAVSRSDSNGGGGCGVADGEQEIGNLEESEVFSWQTISADEFHEDLIIETRKKSGLVLNMTTILESYKSCTSMEESEAANPKGVASRSGGDTGSKNGGRRKKKKGRKINKTGWDNRKSRRKTANKSETGVLKCGETRDNRAMGKVNSLVEGGEERVTDSRAAGDKGRVRETRERVEVGRGGGGSETANRPRSKKKAEPLAFRVRCSRSGRYAFQKRKLVLSRRKKRVRDYSWSTRTR